MEERQLVGLEARLEDGTMVGRITEVISDEESEEVTHAVIERDGEHFEVPIDSLSLDAEADFATFRADRSDEEPGDHAGDVVRPEGYAPAQSDAEDREHEGQFVTTPTDPDEAVSLEQEESTEEDEASGWEDEGSDTVESGYPRTDAYIDPDTGEEEVDPAMNEGESLGEDAERILDGTGLKLRAAKDGVVELTGSVPAQEDLDAVVEELMGLDGVLEVDATDVDVG